MNLVQLRRERKWSQEDLAHEAGVHRTFVTHVERCERNIALDNLEKLARALQVPATRLFQEDLEQRPRETAAKREKPTPTK
ncbi:helix-turn-helix domain-containing protein [Variovorax sp. YR216]|uniref:helix-turn-helix domain-containing protein n=1 Tax=Variovorax sp. YR216 TaxID=1882828 RepID=UPI00210DAE2D|nr:helix-turn-helix transcriptional regulator [Variovorax sp. YR216]